MHLERILARTRQTIAERKQYVSVDSLYALAELHQPRGLVRALRTRAFDGPAILAEIKKASPSRGLIRPDFQPATLALQLRSGGATALSVLTDEPFFEGSLDFLEQASAASSLPCLRKDFIVDSYQIVEARAHRADAILLIAAALGDAELEQFTEEAHALELDVLCEVHTAEELDRVRDLGCDAYGVNNRDLVTFDVDLGTSFELAAELPPGAVHITESGIASRADIDMLREAGFHAFLIGESLMRQPDPGAALAAWLNPALAPMGMR
jgi:indole-3-glycerol phosphate synthase